MIDKAYGSVTRTESLHPYECGGCGKCSQCDAEAKDYDARAEALADYLRERHDTSPKAAARAQGAR